MKIISTLVFTFAVIYNSIELSIQSEAESGSGSSSRSRSSVPASSSSRTNRTSLPGTPRRRLSGEHSGVSSSHNRSSTHSFSHLPQESGRNQIPHADDILLPLALEEWPLLAETLKKDWPAYLEYYYFVQTAIKWRSKEPNLQHTIYCPRGDYNSGIFVAISSFSVYHVIVFAREGFEHLLYKVMTETKIIKWTAGVRFAAVINSRIISTVNSIIETLKHTKGIEVGWNILGNVMFKSKEECAAVNIRVPEGYYLNRINPSHVPLIHSMWLGRDLERPDLTMNLLMTRVRLNGGVGLFSKESNELVSWALQGEYGEICVIHTIEKCRRKGFSKIVINTLSKALAKNGVDSFAIVDYGNFASAGLFQSMNYKETQREEWIQIKRM